MDKKIQFSSHRIKFRLSQQRHLSAWISSVVQKENSAIETLSFIFCSDNYLLGINRDFLQHDYYTDIITFDLGTRKLLNGEIYISIDRIRENAKTFMVPLQEELHRVIIHGVLHLLGYSDKSAKQKRQMTDKENWCLSLRHVSRGTVGVAKR
jgi:probable rRNA maturation factor